MKTQIIGLSLAVMLSNAAFANECTPEIDKIDQQFTSTNPLPPDVLSQAKNLRDQGLELCANGSITEGLAVLAQAKTLLGIQ